MQKPNKSSKTSVIALEHMGIVEWIWEILWKGELLWASVRTWARDIIMTWIFIIITSVIALREMISTSFVLDTKGRLQFICFQLQTSVKWQNLQGTIDILFTDNFPREWSIFVPSIKQLKSICPTKCHLTSDQHTLPLGEPPTNPVWCYGKREMSQIILNPGHV